MIGSVLTPCEKAIAKVHRPTQQGLISLTPSMEVITPTHDENAGTDLKSNKWDDIAHRQEASSSQRSILQDGILSGELRAVYPRVCIDQGPLSRDQRRVSESLLCTLVDGPMTEIREICI